MSIEDSPTTSYIVVPRKDYEGLFNKQYAQLTSLQKKVDPDLEREAFFETTLKTHYPKVYQEMIKNDFLLTRPTAIQHVAAAENAAEKNEHVQMAMQRQLDQVASGRQQHVKLSNPLYLFTQRYLSQLVRDSSLSPPKRRLLYTHLQNYAKRLPFYINRPLQRAEQGTQKNEATDNPPILIDDDDDEPKSSPGGRNERSKQLKDVVRRLRSQRTTPSALRRRVKEEVKSEEGPTLGWLSPLRQRQLDRRQPVKRLGSRTTKKEKGNIMEELTHLIGGGGRKKTSPAFGKNAATVKNVLLRKYPQYKNQLTPAFVRSTLETHSPAYSTTRVTTQQPKSFRGTSFCLPHPHYRWHVDLQDMTIFKRAGKRSKKGTEYNFMLVCVDNCSNFFMIELIKNKRAATVLNAVIKIIQRVKSMPVFIYCDKGSEFDNKLFTDRSTNGF